MLRIFLPANYQVFSSKSRTKLRYTLIALCALYFSPSGRTLSMCNIAFFLFSLQSFFSRCCLSFLSFFFFFIVRAYYSRLVIYIRRANAPMSFACERYSALVFTYMMMENVRRLFQLVLTRYRDVSNIFFFFFFIIDGKFYAKRRSAGHKLSHCR